MKEFKINGSKKKIRSIINSVGLNRPLHMINLKIGFEHLSSNQIAEILADDPGFEDDIAHWCKETHNKLLNLTKNDKNIFVAYVEKN